MQTSLPPTLLKTTKGQRVDEILRKCVHCGFCLATCPTYQITGDELDSPRGRIYQIKQVFEGNAADTSIQMHLDRCLTCRSCETTCPSGVNYAELLDLGRIEVDQQVSRKPQQKLVRFALNAFIPYPKRHRFLFQTLVRLKPYIPAKFTHKIPDIRTKKHYPLQKPQTEKIVYLIEGCVQSTISPNTNQAAHAVLSAMGYQVIREKNPLCCGALSHHSGNETQTQRFIMAQLNQWQKVDKQHALYAIVSTASGCGVMLKDYARLLEPQQKLPHQKLLSKIMDISQLLDTNKLEKKLTIKNQSIAYHAPCTLRHGQQQADSLKEKLMKLGYQIKEPRDAHICCGSAGTYSILQPALSSRLKKDKINHLQHLNPELIITANVGCEHHLASASKTPIQHWIELIANDLDYTA
ncbi:MAG: glycolate oxidase subunit GlcF [bacterium]